jgi:hypothetical protein
MSREERSSVIGIITGLLVNTYVVIRLVQRFLNGAFSGEDAVTAWAQTVVWAIPAAIIITIVLHITFTMTDSERALNNIVDERDRKFQLRGMGTTLVGAAIGYVAMIVTLAFGGDTVVGLTIMYASIALGDLLGNIVRITSYRIGG